MTEKQKILVKQALIQIGMCEVDYYSSLPPAQHTFSERFERKMEKQIRARNSSYYPLIKTPARKLATILIVFLLMFSLSLSVSAIREPVFSALERITEKFTEIIFPSNNDIPFVEYEIGWIPDYYTQTTTIPNGNSITIEWRYLDSYITFEQINHGNIRYNTEGVIIHHAEWANKKISYFQKHNTYLFSWEENGYLFSIVCTADLLLDDVRRMIESIRPAEEG